jgi:hypothetical protein
MRPEEKQVLHDLLNAVANLTENVDAIEAVLIRRGLCTTAEIEAILPAHRRIVNAKLAGLRQAIDRL